MSGAQYTAKCHTVEDFEKAMLAQIANGDAEVRMTARLMLAITKPAMEAMEQNSSGMRIVELLNAIAQVTLSLADSLWMSACITQQVHSTMSMDEARRMHATLYPKLMDGVIRIAPLGKRTFAADLEARGIR